MKSAYSPIRERVLNREELSGSFVNSGSAINAEIAAQSGLDWLLIDLEHGYGGEEALVAQLQAVSRFDAAPFVRVSSSEEWRFKRVLDLGAAGVMVPMIGTAEEARQVVRSIRFPPLGTRGVSSLSRASDYGLNFKDYYHTAHETLTTIIQIETREALENVDAIAAVDGVDVIFLGPADLSANLSAPLDFEHREFKAARERILESAARCGKAAGIILFGTDQLEAEIRAGFTFVAVASDSGLYSKAIREIAGAFRPFR